jgi:hypothetical protein
MFPSLFQEFNGTVEGDDVEYDMYLRDAEILLVILGGEYHASFRRGEF